MPFTGVTNNLKYIQEQEQRNQKSVASWIKRVKDLKNKNALTTIMKMG